MDLLDVEPKQRKIVHYETNFYRNTNMVSEFKVSFLPFPLIQRSGASFSDTIFFSSFSFILLQIFGESHI